jgi:tetratricopeptide (TPR) repeat protein
VIASRPQPAYRFTHEEISAPRNPGIMTSLRILFAATLAFSLETVAQEDTPPPLSEADLSSEWFQEANRLYDAAKVEWKPKTGDRAKAYRYFKASIPLFERFINTYPENPDAPKARYRSGQAYLLTGDRGAAEGAFLDTLNMTNKRGHTASTAAFRLGALAYNDKYYKTARPYFAITARETDKPDLRHQALNYQARCLMLTERISEAETVLRRLVNDPDEPNKFKNQASLALAHIAATTGKLEEAFALYQTIANSELNPETAEEGFLGI